MNSARASVSTSENPFGPWYASEHGLLDAPGPESETFAPETKL